MWKSLFARRSSYLDAKTIDQVQFLCRSVENRLNLVDLQRQLVHLFDCLTKKSSKKSSREILREHWKFSLSKDRSQTDRQGIFLDWGRIEEAGRIVGIYPGTIYRRSFDPLLLPSIGNQFLLARKDNFIIDGRDRGLSRSIYLSSYYRCPRYDKSWLLQDFHQHENPLTLGHYINHFPSHLLPNVTYFEFDFQFENNQSKELDRFIPHVRYAPNDDEDDFTMPSTLLISLRPIEQGEELFSCYLNLIQQQNDSNR